MLIILDIIYIHLVDYQTERSLYLGLIDIIFAYVYDYRITDGDGSVSNMLLYMYCLTTPISDHHNYIGRISMEH